MKECRRRARQNHLSKQLRSRRSVKRERQEPCAQCERGRLRVIANQKRKGRLEHHSGRGQILRTRGGILLGTWVNLLGQTASSTEGGDGLRAGGGGGQVLDHVNYGLTADSGARKIIQMPSRVVVARCQICQQSTYSLRRCGACGWSRVRFGAAGGRGIEGELICFHWLFSPGSGLMGFIIAQMARENKGFE